MTVLSSFFCKRVKRVNGEVLLEDVMIGGGRFVVAEKRGLICHSSILPLVFKIMML